MKFIQVISVLIALEQVHSSPAYSYDEKSDLDFPDWMSKLNDSTRLCDISMPGAHQALAVTADWVSECQIKSLSTLLTAGIRMVDLRVKIVEDSAFVVHHKWHVFGELTHALSTIRDFLDGQPTETVLLRFYHDVESESPGQAFRIFTRYFQGYHDYIFLPNNSAEEITMGDVRRKMVIFSEGIDLREDPQTKNIYQYEQVFKLKNTNDNWKFDTDWHLYTKWEEVRDFLKSSHYGKGYRLNYLTGMGGSFPYFVASGKSSPATNAPRLSTGLQGSTGKYPEFPRFMGYIVYEGINVMTYQYLLKNKPDFTGIIMADFPGSGLIDEIIKCNFRPH